MPRGLDMIRAVFRLSCPSLLQELEAKRNHNAHNRSSGVGCGLFCLDCLFQPRFVQLDRQYITPLLLRNDPQLDISRRVRAHLWTPLLGVSLPETCRV